MNDSIKTKKFDSVKSTIFASVMCCHDFDGCDTLYKDFIKQSGEALQFHIAVVGTVGARDDGDIIGGNVKVDNWYYKKEDFNMLISVKSLKLCRK